MSRLSNRLIELREMNGYGVLELSENINVPIEIIKKWEKARRVPTIGELVSLSHLYGMEVPEILEGRVVLYKVRKSIQKKLDMVNTGIVSAIVGLLMLIFIMLLFFTPAMFVK